MQMIFTSALRPPHVLAIVVAALCACDRTGTEAGDRTARSGSGTWLSGTIDERFAIVGKQLRGFDVAMVETGYRYVELYWAGHDGNWPYAAYQLEKIETAVAHGVERRPKRAGSTAMLAPAIAGVRAAVERGDGTAFGTAFTVLTQTCNACHVAEQVPFVLIDPPERRGAPVRAQALAPVKPAP